MIGDAGPFDVVVAGDGPAAAAVVAACRRRSLSVVAVGPSASWSATYGLWRDEVPDLPDSCFAELVDRTLVRARNEWVIDRRYGVIDNVALRRHLGLDDVRRHGSVVRQESRGDVAVATIDTGDTLVGRWVVDATGTDVARAWQTAYGVVVSDADAERAGVAPHDATVMAWLADAEPACFVYSVPRGDGRLVEITSLAARPAVDPQRLRRVLVQLLGEAPVVAAEALGRVETVRIPMGGPPPPDAGGRIVPFGTAGGTAHPASGYSLAASLRMAEVLADTVSNDGDPIAAIWPAAMRRTRALHDAGLGVLLRLDRDGVVDFFEAFFGLPADLWADYLRVDAPEERVVEAMQDVFRRAPWSVRRRLLAIDPRLLGALLRRTGAR